MKPVSTEGARAAAEHFDIPGSCVDLTPFRRGHIHDTFIARWRGPDGERRFLHQRINDEVFRDVPVLMHNIHCVTRHLRAAPSGPGDLETIELVPTREGELYWVSPDGPWRTYTFVENTESYDLCKGTEQAFEAASAFGQFQALLTGLDASELGATIPQFFSSPHRLRELEAALADDPVDRAASVASEIDFALQRRAMVDIVEQRLRGGRWPERVIHGDTKLNNILFDVDTGRARSIVDLDTCMPGYSLYDFGDLVRFTAATSGEDERDLDRVEMDLDVYRALAGGYLEQASTFLTDDEVQHMPFCARLVTFTIGLRFLADHLAGDVYFKTAREGHNLDRARVQFKLVESMERQEREMAAG